MILKNLTVVSLAALIAGPVLAQGRKPTDDLNGDGKVTVAEYTEARGARSIERMDADKDGKVTVAERLAAAGVRIDGDAEGRGRASDVGAKSTGIKAARAAQGSEKSVTATELKASIRARAAAMDANGDGVLSLDEMRSGRGAQPAG